MAGRKSVPGQVVPGSEKLEKKYKTAKHEASGSLQPHMLYARKEIRKLVMERLSAGVPPANRTEKEPFQYAVVDGALYVKLAHPILRKETKEIIDPVSEAIKKIRTEYREREGIKRKGLTRGEYPPEVSMPSELQVLWEGGKPPSETRASGSAEEPGEDERESEGESPETTGLGNILFTKFPLLALTSKMGCLAGDSLVLVKERGVCRLDELPQDRSFTVWSGKAWRTATCRMTGIKQTVELTTNWGFRLRLTDDHRVLTHDREWIPVGELEKGDHIAFEPPDGANVECSSIEFRQSEAGDNFPRMWSYDLGCFLGHIIGDGTVRSEPNAIVWIGIAEQDRSTLDRLQSIVNPWVNSRAEVLDLDPKPNWVCETPQKMVTLSWHIARLSRFLEHLGVDKVNAPEYRRLPKSIWSAGTQAARGLLAGLFGADGCAGTSNNPYRVHISVSSVSLPMLEDVQRLLLFFFGIKSSINAFPSSNKDRLEKGYRSLYALNVTAHADVLRFASFVGFDNVRKQARLEDAIPLYGKEPYRKRVHHSRLKYLQVRSVCPNESPEPVYDLSVETDHQFVANGITVHNCFSFNLPAGPATHGFYGTCLAASYGFPMLYDSERPRRASKWLNEVMGKELTRTDFFHDECDKKGKCFQDKFLCSGCYGLKGLYGSPMIFTMMECRKQWVETMIRPKYREQFVKVMVKAIRMAQAQSITSRFFLEEMGLQDQIWTIPDPAYFRIHDVGDVFHEEYLDAWFQVIRQCAEPMRVKRLGFTLPAIRFWMPSRMWIFPGRVSDHFKCMGAKPSCVPGNLTIRPSAVHFGDPSPSLKAANGLAMGAGSTGIGQALTDKDMKEAEKVVGKLYGDGGKGWICPAYLAPEKLGGGGAEWAPMGGKRKGLQLVGGACARAFGPDGEPPAPKGKGCRACWDRPELKIVYPEH